MNSSFLNEIMEQPGAVRRCVEQFPVGSEPLVRLGHELRAGHYRQVLLTGMGSSYHSCYPLWLALSAARIPASLWDASELLHYAPQALSDDTLLIAVSQSGESAEIRRLTQLAQQPGMSVTVTNGVSNSAARWSRLPLNTWAGEEATVSTKTYVTSLAALHLLGVHLLGGDPHGAAAELLITAGVMAHFLTERVVCDAAAAFLLPCEQLAYMGRGPSLASAMTAALITQESSKVFCSGSSAAQFRHGPIEAARPGFRAVIMAGNDDSLPLNLRLAQEIAKHGGRSVLILPDRVRDRVEENPGVFPLTIPTADLALLPLLEIVPVQLMTIPFARAKGLEPALFQQASKVTLEE